MSRNNVITYDAIIIAALFLLNTLSAAESTGEVSSKSPDIILGEYPFT
jgi:hypothetical protein